MITQCRFILIKLHTVAQLSSWWIFRLGRKDFPVYCVPVVGRIVMINTFKKVDSWVSRWKWIWSSQRSSFSFAYFFFPLLSSSSGCISNIHSASTLWVRWSVGPKWAKILRLAWKVRPTKSSWVASYNNLALSCIWTQILAADLDRAASGLLLVWLSHDKSGKGDEVVVSVVLPLGRLVVVSLTFCSSNDDESSSS